MKGLPGLVPGETCSTSCNRDRHDEDCPLMQIISPPPKRPRRQVVRFRENSLALSGTRRPIRGKTCSTSCTLRQCANRSSSEKLLAERGYMGQERPGSTTTLSRDTACRVLSHIHWTHTRHLGCLDPPGRYRWPSDRGLDIRAAPEARTAPTWSRSLSDPGCKRAPRSADRSHRFPPFFCATAIARAARALVDGSSPATLPPLVRSLCEAGAGTGLGMRQSRRCPHTFQPGRDCSCPARSCGVLQPMPHHHPLLSRVCALPFSVVCV